MVNAKIIVPIIAGVILVSIIVTVIIVHYKNDNRAPILPPSPKSVKCPASIDKGVLKSCDPKNPDTCDACEGGLYGCFTIKGPCPPGGTGSQEITTESNSSCYPIKFKDPKTGKSSTLYVPDGNWCLPSNIITGKCNEFSGFPILTQKDPTTFEWRCQCKYPTIFENKSEFGDCTRQVACNGLLSDKNKFVCPTGSTFCTPGTEWVDDPTWPPTRGTCACTGGLKPIDRSNKEAGIWDFECVDDQCSPGVTNSGDSTKCDCPEATGQSGGRKSYIDCPSDMPDGRKNLCESTYPMCIIDPCNPGGVYDINSGSCKCDADKGYINTQDQNSAIGYTCLNPCSPINNPCASRGTCYLDQNKKAKCKDCNYGWYQDDKGMCLNPMKDIGSRCDGGYQCLSGSCNPEYVFGGHHICTF